MTDGPKIVLCATFDSSGTQAAVPRAAERAGELDGTLLVLTPEVRIPTWICNSAVGALAGLPPCDAGQFARDEVEALVVDRCTSYRCVCFADAKRVVQVFEALVEEAIFIAAYVGVGSDGRSSLVSSISPGTLLRCEQIFAPQR